MAKAERVYLYDGNAARQWNTLPEEIPEQHPKQQPKRQPKPKKKTSKLLMASIGVSALIVVGTIFTMLNEQLTVTNLQSEVVALESQVTDLQRENINARQDLEEEVNLQDIYDKAMKELGMRTPDKKQIYTYESKKSTQVRVKDGH